MKRICFGAFFVTLSLTVVSACRPEVIPPAAEATSTYVTLSVATATLPVLSTKPVITATFAVTPTQEPAHRIGVRQAGGMAEFYDRLTGEKFVPRGYNYIRLAPMSKTNPGLRHSTLNPGLYETERAEAALQAIHVSGYNVVRIFVDCCRAGNNAGDPKGGVSLAYLENVINTALAPKEHPDPCDYFLEDPYR